MTLASTADTRRAPRALARALPVALALAAGCSSPPDPLVGTFVGTSRFTFGASSLNAPGSARLGAGTVSTAITLNVAYGLGMRCALVASRGADAGGAVVTSGQRCANGGLTLTVASGTTTVVADELTLELAGTYEDPESTSAPRGDFTLRVTGARQP